MAKIKSFKYLDKDDPIYKEGFKISSHNKSLQNYIKAREIAENKENLFLEKISWYVRTYFMYGRTDGRTD